MRRHERRRIPPHDNRTTRWQRDVRVLAIARAITVAGGEAGYIALLALAWQLTGSPAQASLVLLASVAGGTLGGPLAGWIGDHLNRRAVILCAELVVGAAYASLALADSMTHVLIALAIGAFGGITAGAAVDAAAANLAPPGELVRVNGTIGMGRTTGHMLGPLLGGALVALAGARSAFVLDGITSVLAGVLVAALVRGSLSRSAAQHDASSSSVLEGARTIARDRVLGWYVAGWLVMCACFGTVLAAELPIAVEHGYDEVGIGLIVTAWCAGSLLGGWCVRTVALHAPTSSVLLRTALTCAVVFALTGMTPWFTSVLPLMAIGGFAMALADSRGATLLQTRADDGVRARVIATQQALNSAVWGGSLAGAALLVERTSAGTAYVLAGGIALLAAVVQLQLGRAMRREQHARLVREVVPRHALEADLSASA